MSVKVMSWVWENGPADPVDRLTLLALADFANDEGVSWPSMIGLGAKVGMTDRGVRGVIRRLEAAGWLHTKVGGGRGGKSIYTVLMGRETRNEASEFKAQETRNEKPGISNPEYQTRNTGSGFNGKNPERDDTKPGSPVPPNRQEPSEVSKKKSNARAIMCEWASPAAVDSFIAYRRGHKRGGPMTDTAAKRIAASLREIFDAGGDTDDALAMAEERGWIAIKADWYFNAKRTETGNGNGTQRGIGFDGDRTLRSIARVAGAF